MTTVDTLGLANEQKGLHVAHDDNKLEFKKERKEGQTHLKFYVIYVPNIAQL